MALHGPTSLVHWLAGYDLAGEGATVEIAESTKSATQEQTPLGPKGAIRHHAPLGRLIYEMRESGFTRDRQSSLRRMFADGAAATPWPSILGHEGGAIGASCILATDMRIAERGIVPDLDGISKAELMYYLHEGGDVHQDAVLLAHGAIRDVQDNRSSYRRYHLDSGASSDGGATICLMADIEVSRWRGYPDLSLRVLHSNNAGGGYANLTNVFDLERDDDGSTVIEIASGTTIMRYLYLWFQFSGARDAWRLDGAKVIGDTALTIDGAGATGRPEPGQTITINANPYTITSAVETATAGAWDIEIDPGLIANANDDVAILVTGNNTVLRYAAAIERR